MVNIYSFEVLFYLFLLSIYLVLNISIYVYLHIYSQLRLIGPLLSRVKWSDYPEYPINR